MILLGVIFGLFLIYIYIYIYIFLILRGFYIFFKMYMSESLYFLQPFRTRTQLFTKVILFSFSKNKIKNSYYLIEYVE
jgi:hypothetical protein